MPRSTRRSRIPALTPVVRPTHTSCGKLSNLARTVTCIEFSLMTPAQLLESDRGSHDRSMGLQTWSASVNNRRNPCRCLAPPWPPSPAPSRRDSAAILCRARSTAVCPGRTGGDDSGAGGAHKCQLVTERNDLQFKFCAGRETDARARK